MARTTKTTTAARRIPWVAGFLFLGIATAARGEAGFDHCAHGGKQSFALLSGDLIGEDYLIPARKSDSLHDIACRYNIGVEEMFMANDPLGIDHWAPGDGTQVMIPQRFILPNAPRAGIVVNIPEMRLYFFPVKYAPAAARKVSVAPKPKPKPLLDANGKPKLDAKGKPIMVTPPAPPPPKAAEPAALGEPIGHAAEVITYPISMGRMDWRTPLGRARVISKIKDPTWTPPESIRREHAAKGDILPAVVPAGPENPLGRFAMRLSVPGYLIHGTEENYKSFGIGMRVTHGCMRMYNEDVARLFPMVSVGTPVHLVNQPVKLGWAGGALYMEVSQPLDEDVGIPPEKDEEDMTAAELAREEAKTADQRAEEKRRKDAKRSAYLLKVATALIDREAAKRPVALDREAIRKAVEQPTGRAVAIGREQAPVIEAAPEPYSPEPPQAPGAVDPYGYGTGGAMPAPRPPAAAAETVSRPPVEYPPPAVESPEETRPGNPSYSQYPYGAPSTPARYSAPPPAPRPASRAPAPSRSPAAADPYYSAPENSSPYPPPEWSNDAPAAEQSPETYDPGASASENADPYAPAAVARDPYAPTPYGLPESGRNP